MAEAHEIADAVVKRVAELTDRSSPDDWPEAMLVTGAELHAIVADEITNRLAQHAASIAEVKTRLVELEKSIPALLTKSHRLNPLLTSAGAKRRASAGIKPAADLGYCDCGTVWNMVELGKTCPDCGDDPAHIEYGEITLGPIAHGANTEAR